MTDQIAASALQPTKAPEGQTSHADPAAAAMRGQDSICVRASSCCGPGVRTARQKIGGAAFFLALAALVLAKIYGVI